MVGRNFDSTWVGSHELGINFMIMMQHKSQVFYTLGFLTVGERFTGGYLCSKMLFIHGRWTEL